MSSRLSALAALIAASVVFLALGGWGILNDTQQVEEFFTDHGALGPLVFIISMWILQPAGVPGALFMVPAAVVWPLPTAMALSWIGNMGASTIAFAMARWFARDWAQERLPSRLRAWDTRLSVGSTTNTLFQVTLFRIVTGQLTPADWVLGVSGVRLREFFVGTAVGIVPGVVLITTLGGGLVDVFSGRRARLGLLVVVLGLGVVRRLRRRARSVERSRG